MKKQLITIVSLILLGSTVFAQVETFDLSKFKLPYLKYQNLILNFNTSNEGQADGWKDTTDYKYNYSNIYSYLSAGGSYYMYLNTPTEQSTYSLGANLYMYPYSGNKRTYDDESTDLSFNSSIYFQITGSSRNRFYISSPLFVEVGPSIGVYYSRNFYKNIDKDDEGNTIYEYKSRSNTPQINTSLEVGIGYGRIEEVTDAQMALFILKDLKKENRLTREPTHDEIYKFAELISQKRYQRFFDNRHRIIDEVKAIDSFLTSLGLSDQTDATYFTTIYDNWLYANNPNRASGFRVSGGPRLVFNTSQSKSSWELLEPTQNNDESKTKSSLIAYGAWVDLLDEKPINHYWQRTLQANVSYIFTNGYSTINDDPKNKRLQDNLELNLNASLGYYPTTRTYINFGLGGGLRINNMDKYSYPADTDYNDEQFRYVRIYAGPSVNGYYYFSPKLRLSFDGSLNYNFYNTDNFSLISPPFGFGFTYVKANRINAYFGASITYAIF